MDEEITKERANIEQDNCYRMTKFEMICVNTKELWRDISITLTHKTQCLNLCIHYLRISLFLVHNGYNIEK